MHNIHELKIKECYWQDVWNGRKTFEIRKNDRNYKVGDVIRFKVIDDSGEEISAFTTDMNDKYNRYLITYVFEGGSYGLDKDYCVLAIRQIVKFASAKDRISRVRDLISCLCSSPLDNVICPVVDEEDNIFYELLDVLRGRGTSQGITYLDIRWDSDINESEEENET